MNGRTLSSALALMLSLTIAGCDRPLSTSSAPVSEASLSVGRQEDKVGAEVWAAFDRGESPAVIVTLNTTPHQDLDRQRTEVAEAQDGVLRAVTAQELRVVRRFRAVPGFSAVALNRGALMRMAADPRVQRVDIELGGGGVLGPSVAFIRADLRHTAGNRGSGVVVGVFDTGIDTDHPDFAGAIVGQACFGSGNGFRSDFCPNGTSRQVGAGAAEDNAGHGTHVSGIVASRGTVSSPGVAPAASLVAIKVMDNCSFAGCFYAFSEIVAALDYVLTTPSLGVKIVNMSLGTGARYPGNCDNINASTLAGASVVNQLRTAGVTVFASSGNNADNFAMGLPACLANVISVGAVSTSDVLAAFSNHTPTTDILAPGVGVTSLAIGGGTTIASGTSMASPMAAGCAALLIQAGDATTPATIETRLKTSPVSLSRNGVSVPRIDCGPAAPTLAPVLTAINAQSGAELTAIGFTATATDDGLPAALTYSLGTPACVNTPAVPAEASITSAGVFSWTPTEADGPGVYCARVVVSDGALTDFEDVQITVTEVNVAPVFALKPADSATPGGTVLTSFQLTAPDADLPANTLTFSKVSGPSWISVAANGVISYTEIPSADIGAQLVTVKVSDGALEASHSYTITVGKRATALTYDGRTAGQYSDQSILSATLTDASPGAASGSAIDGASVAFTFGGAAVIGSPAATGADGKASVLHQVLSAASVPAVAASFSTTSLYAGSSDSKSFTVGKETGTLSNIVIASGGSIPVSQTSFTVTVDARELRTAGVEPAPQDGAMPGDASLITMAANISGIATSSSYNGSCVGVGGSASYASTRTFTCTFTGGPFAVDAYTLTLRIPASNAYWTAASYEEALVVWDPKAGFAAGGGSFLLDGDRVSFGFSYTLQKGKTVPRSGFVALRHLADGGVCRVKSTNAMNAPAVSGNTVTLSGKGNYTCVDALGVTTASAGNISIAAYAEDNATSGVGADKFAVTNGAPVADNKLQMPIPLGISAILLSGGNVQVPKP
jgi:subtilisin family serine protease